MTTYKIRFSNIALRTIVLLYESVRFLSNTNYIENDPGFEDICLGRIRSDALKLDYVVKEK